MQDVDESNKSNKILKELNTSIVGNKLNLSPGSNNETCSNIPDDKHTKQGIPKYLLLPIDTDKLKDVAKIYDDYNYFSYNNKLLSIFENWNIKGLLRKSEWKRFQNSSVNYGS